MNEEEKKTLETKMSALEKEILSLKELIVSSTVEKKETKKSNLIDEVM